MTDYPDAQYVDYEEYSVTALEARRLRLKTGRPLAEVDRWWKVESCNGLFPHAVVPFERLSRPTDYRELAKLEGQ